MHCDYSQVVQQDIDEIKNYSEVNLKCRHSINAVVIVREIHRGLASHRGDIVIGRGLGVHNNKWGPRIALQNTLDNHRLVTKNFSQTGENKTSTNICVLACTPQAWLLGDMMR
jgi:hypothetical protein